jgi:hypothetical protein
LEGLQTVSSRHNNAWMMDDGDGDLDSRTLVIGERGLAEEN